MIFQSEVQVLRISFHHRTTEETFSTNSHGVEECEQLSFISCFAFFFLVYCNVVIVSHQVAIRLLIKCRHEHTLKTIEQLSSIDKTPQVTAKRRLKNMHLHRRLVSAIQSNATSLTESANHLISYSITDSYSNN